MNISKRTRLGIILKISALSVFIIASFLIIKPVFAGGPCTIKDADGNYTLPAGCDPTIKINSSGTTPNVNSSGTTPTIDSSGTTGGVSVNTGIKNPLGSSIQDLPTLIQAILRFAILIGIPIVTLAIIYCGFLFVTASGNSEKLKKAKQALLYTIVGAALLLGSMVISSAIKGTVDKLQSERKIYYI